MKNSLKNQLQKMIEKNQRTLKAADDLVTLGDYESASSRAYYAVFYLL